MSALAKRTPKIYIDKDNYDVFDTLNGPFVEKLPQGQVKDTAENRLNAALACLYSVAIQLRNTQNNVTELEKRIQALENK